MNLGPILSSVAPAIEEYERQLADPMSAAALTKALQDLRSQSSGTDAQVATARQELLDLLSQAAPPSPAPKRIRDVVSDEERKWLPIIQFLGNALSRSGVNPGTQAVQGYLGARKEDVEHENQQAQEEHQRQLADRERRLRASGMKLEALDSDRRDLRSREERLRADLLGAQRQQELAQDRATDNRRQAVSVLNQVKFPSQVRPTAKTLALDLTDEELKAIEQDVATRNSEQARKEYSHLVTQVWSNSASTGMTEANKRLLESMRRALALQYGVPESTFSGVWTGITGQSERALKTLASKAADRKQRADQFRQMMEHRKAALKQAKDIAGLKVAAETARVYAAIDERARQFDAKLANGYYDKEAANLLEKDKATLGKTISQLTGKLQAAEARAKAAGLEPGEDPRVAEVAAELRYWQDQLAAIDEDTAMARAMSAESIVGAVLGGSVGGLADRAEAARQQVRDNVAQKYPQPQSGRRYDVGRLRRAAQDAIRAGKDANAVRARFRQLTGQEL